MRDGKLRREALPVEGPKVCPSLACVECEGEARGWFIDNAHLHGAILFTAGRALF